jgi:hypothetical protein
MPLGARHGLLESSVLFDQVVTDPSLGFLGPCEVVPRVLILISSPRVLDK